MKEKLLETQISPNVQIPSRPSRTSRAQELLKRFKELEESSEDQKSSDNQMTINEDWKSTLSNAWDTVKKGASLGWDDFKLRMSGISDSDNPFAQIPVIRSFYDNYIKLLKASRRHPEYFDTETLRFYDTTSNRSGNDFLSGWKGYLQTFIQPKTAKERYLSQYIKDYAISTEGSSSYYPARYRY